MKYIVWLYDGMDREWIKVSEPVSREEAERIWREKTANGMKNTTYNDIDYYSVKPE